MGKSGSGKSTLLGLLAALDYPDSGSVELAGQTLSSFDEDALAVVRQRDMGFVFQSFHLLPTLTVAENIAFPLDIARRPNKARVNELIEAVDLGHTYNTAENAEDVNDLRLALGVQKINLWGHSYGSHLGLAILKRHGNTIHRAALSGVNGRPTLPISYRCRYNIQAY